MSFLTMYHNQLKRERDKLQQCQKTVGDLATKLATKRRELLRANTPSRLRSLRTSVERLEKDLGKAQTGAANQLKKVTAAELKVTNGESHERDAAARRQGQHEQAQERSRRRLERSTVATATGVKALQVRVDKLERAVLDQVREAVAADPVDRQFDIFLSHAGPNTDTGQVLYDELTARGLTSWFDGAELRLGESITRQIDLGIARSKVGVILVTQELLEGRYWTEREMGAFISTRKRIIPVLDGPTFDDLGTYSPLLVDLKGLSTENMGFDEIAEKIARAISLPVSSGE
ncbi:MAG: toll/interleukin-1 receptor domain-containing protein [Actinomycetota bacterium]